MRGAASTPATRWSCSTICRPGIARRVPRGVPLVEARHPRSSTPCAALLRRAPRRRGDALRRLADGRRVGAQAGRVLPEQRRRHAGVLEAMARRGRDALHLLVDLRGLRRAGIGADRRDASDSSRSTPTARRSWRSSARCRTSSAPTACSWIALRYFNAAGADPDGELGEDHAAEIHLIPLRHSSRPRRRRRCRCSARTIRRRTAPACATTSTSCDLADAHVRALEALERGGAVGRLQRRHRHAALGARR